MLITKLGHTFSHSVTGDSNFTAVFGTSFSGVLFSSEANNLSHMILIN